MSILKKVSDLFLYDFTVSPIWTWAETDDEDLVEPLENTNPLSDDHDALFVSCEFLLRDGTVIIGEISVRMSDHFVYLLGLLEANGKFFHFPLHPLLKGQVTPEQLADFLRTSVENISRIRVKTPYIFSKREPLIRTIDF